MNWARQLFWARQRRPRRDRGPSSNRQAQRHTLQFESLESRRMLDGSQFVINEVLINPHGVDGGQEYIEIRATAGVATTLPAGTYLLGIEGDTFTANPGDVQNIFDLSGLTTGANGILVLAQKGSNYVVAFEANKIANTGSGAGWGNGVTSSLGHSGDGILSDIENTSLTLMLVFAPTAPTLANDIDANNDGTPDGAAFAGWTVLDSVGILDGENNDVGYGVINFRNGSAGNSQGAIVEVDFNAGYVARKGAATGSTTDAWVAGYVTGSANNWSLSSTKVSDAAYAGHALNHVGSANPNTIPTLAHSAGAFDEGGSRAFTSADLQATDLEQSAAALQFALSSLPVHGFLQKDGSPLAVGDQFTLADIDAGRISYTHDGSETTSDSFDFSVSDAAGGVASGSFAITITPVNDLPSLVVNAGLAIDEDAAATITASLLQTTDNDNTAEQLTYTVVAVPAHGTLTKSGVPLAANETFTQHDLDQGLIAYKHNGDLASADAFTFTVSDGSGGTLGESTFAIAITQLNLPPTIAANESSVSVAEGSAATMSGTYADTDGELVILTATVGTVLDNGDGTWTWTLTPVDGPEDSQTVTITIDDGLATAQASFTLEVANIAPSIAANAAEVSVNEGETATNSGVFSDVAADTVTLSANIGAVFDNGDGTWAWSFTPDNGPQDPQTVTITADDGLAQSQVTFTLTVANLAPSIAASAIEVSVNEGETATNSGTFSDVAADTVTLSASVGMVTDNGDGTWAWSWLTANGPEDSQTVTITADDGVAQTQVTFTLNVANVAPALAANSGTVSTLEGSIATNTGTLSDVAADTVMLSASVGAVTNHGDGTWSWTYDTTDALDGSQLVTITADDGLAQTQIAFEFHVINTDPEIEADSAEVLVDEGQTATNTGTFENFAAETLVLTASIGAITKGENGTWSWSYAPADGPADSQTVTITADDGVGHAEATFTLSVSNVAPAIAANAIEVSVSEGETAANSGTLGDVAADTVTLSASIGTVTDNGDGTWAWSYATIDGPEDSQTVTITADDGVAQSQITFALTVNNVAPSIAANLNELIVSEGETATNSGTFGDAGTDLVTLTASIGTVTDNGDGTWAWSCAPGNGPQDPQTVTITADDGLAQSQVTFTLTVANLAPSLAANAAEVSINEGETATNSGTFSDIAADTVTFTASVGTVTDNGDGTWSWSWLTANGPEDSQTVTITADDGLAQSQVTFTLTVANLAPSIAANAAEVSVNEGEIATNTGTFDDVAADTVTLTASVGTVTDNGDGSWSWSYATTDGPEDSQSVTISADDGVAQSQVTFALTVNNTAPSVAVNLNEIVANEGETATNSGTFGDAGTDLVTLTASIGTVTDIGDGTWSWNYSTTDGPDESQTVTITAGDGVAQSQVTFTLTVANLAPSIAANAAEVSINEGETATNSGTFADVAADTVTLTASVGTVTDNGDGTWAWSWPTANGPEDSQTVTITTDDGVAQSQVTFTLSVANLAASIAANAAEVAVNEGETASNTGTFADVAADTVTLTASVGTVTDNGDGTWAWSWPTANGPQDSQTVTIIADDGLAQSQVTFALTVNNAAPSIAANLNEVTVSESETATNSGTFSDAGSDLITLTASIGTVTDNGDGTWSWTFATTSATLDTGSITITATDSDNLLSTVVFQLVVNAPVGGGATMSNNEDSSADSEDPSVTALDDAFALLAADLA